MSRPFCLLFVPVCVQRCIYVNTQSLVRFLYLINIGLLHGVCVCVCVCASLINFDDQCSRLGISS